MDVHLAGQVKGLLEVKVLDFTDLELDLFFRQYGVFSHEELSDDGFFLWGD